MSKYVPIAQIRRDGGTQSRAAMDENTIADYVEVVKAGTGQDFPAIELFFDGTDYWLADGFHRVEAHSRAGNDKIWANVRQGTRRDAVLASVGANANHGLRRTNEDKKRAAMTLLTDDEWSKWSDRQIAKQLGISPQSVNNYRKEIPSSQNGQITERTVTRGGTTYTMKVENIGSSETIPTVADLHKQNRDKVGETEQIADGSWDIFLFAYEWTVYPDKKKYIFLGSDAVRAYARTGGAIKNELITIKGEKVVYAQIAASSDNALVAKLGEFYTMPLEESTLYTADITSKAPVIETQSSTGYTVLEKKPAPQLQTPQDPPKLEDVTQHEGLKLHYLKPQVLIDIETHGMWRNAYHVLKKRYAQDAILLCKISGHGFVAMNEDATAFEQALANVPHEGKRVGDYYLMPDVQTPFYSEVLRLASKKILYFAWVGNDATLFWREYWNQQGKLVTETVAVTDETPIFGEGEQVYLTANPRMKGTVRYVKLDKPKPYGVFLHHSQSTHYYGADELSSDIEDIELPAETTATVETTEETSSIKEGDTVRTRTNHLGQVESVQGAYVYLKGSSNPHKIGTVTLVSNTNIVNPPVRYFGGKFRIAEWIIEQFPTHTTYVEPFAGGASVLFRKQPSKIEVLNDLNGEVVNFFDVLRTRPDELIRVIELTPYSREEHRRAHEVTGDELERARRFYVRSRQSYGSGEGEYNTGWRFQANDKRGTTNVEEWNKTDALWQAATRLKAVQIECDNALNTIKRFDGPNTLFYVDPPYLPETRSTSNEYRHEMTEAQHIELADVLNAVQGMVILSGYKSELYSRMYGDWHCISKETRANDNAPTVEYLWINAAANALNRLPLFEGLGVNE